MEENKQKFALWAYPDTGQLPQQIRIHRKSRPFLCRVYLQRGQIRLSTPYRGIYHAGDDGRL